MWERIKKYFLSNPEKAVVYINWNEIKYWQKGGDIRYSSEETFFSILDYLLEKNK